MMGFDNRDYRPTVDPLEGLFMPMRKRCFVYCGPKRCNCMRTPPHPFEAMPRGMVAILGIVLTTAAEVIQEASALEAWENEGGAAQ